jgi:hypothetical protein
VITELAGERVEFTCGHCRYRWSADYDVQRFVDAPGDEWEYFSHSSVANRAAYPSSQSRWGMPSGYSTPASPCTATPRYR